MPSSFGQLPTHRTRGMFLTAPTRQSTKKGKERLGAMRRRRKRERRFFCSIVKFETRFFFIFSFFSSKHKKKMISLSRTALSVRLGASRAALATRTIATGGYGNKDEVSGPRGVEPTVVHPAPPAPTNEEQPLDVEREREEVRRHARGGATDPGIDEERMRVDPGAERGPVSKSLHTAKGKIKEAVGEKVFCFFLHRWRRRRRRRRGRKNENKNSTLTSTFSSFFLSLLPPALTLSLLPHLNLFRPNKT